MKKKLEELVAKEWRNLLLVLAYIVIASFVYVVWFESMWHLWYVNVITVLVIAATGCTIGYFYIKGEMAKKAQKEEVKPEPEVKEEVVEESK